MGERKKLTMYYPPDFDPKLVPRQKRDPNFTCEVRMMLPFSVQCGKCGEFMYMGKKFNSKKENAQGEKYKGIQIIRFWIKCSTCSNQMSFKTDPENDDYAMESGGTRTFEMWQEVNSVAADNAKERIEEDNDDAMTALENRTRDTQRMVDALDALDELKAVSQRNERIGVDALLAAGDARRAAVVAGLQDEDEELVRSAFAASKKGLAILDDDDGGAGGFVLDELEGGPAKGKGGKPGKKRAAKDTKLKSSEVGADSDVATTTAAPAEAAAASASGGKAPEVSAGNEDTASALLLRAVEVRGAQERAMNAALPVIKRKLLKPAGGDKAKKAKAVPAETPAAPAPASALMGLGDYGSSGDSD